MEESNIIIVDDTKEVLSSFERELRDKPYNVLYAKSGEDALRVLSENLCKVIIADVKMPNMDGFELLEKIKDLYPDMIRIVLSGHSDVKLILKIVNEKGIDRYLTKPWNIEDVQLTIRQSIELFDLRTELYELRKRLRTE